MSEIEKVQASVLRSQEKLPVTGVGEIYDALGAAAAVVAGVASEAAGITAALADITEGQEHASNAAAAMSAGKEHLAAYLMVIMGASATPAHLVVRQGRVAEAIWLPSAAERQPLPGIDEEFAHLKAAEQSSAHPDDLLFTGPIFPEQPEYAHLLANGITADALAKGHITRGDLLRAGYIFLNRIGGGEKHIFSGDIPVISQPGQSVNYSKRTFLTRAEVQTVYDYQQQHPDEFGTHGIPLDELRRDMLLFLRAAVTRPHFEHIGDFIQKCFPYEPGAHRYDFSVDEIIYSQEEWDTVAAYFKAKAKEFSKLPKDQQHTRMPPFIAVKEAFAHEQCSDLFTLRAEGDYFGARHIRNTPIHAIPSRRAKLRGQPSPFLENGFAFGDNLDACVYFGDADIRAGDQMRINMATVHLAGGHPDFPGLTEMGGTKEQVYMTPGTYASRLYPQTAEAVADRAREARATQQQDRPSIVAEAQRRILAEAEAYKAEQGARRWKWLPGQ